MKFLEGAKKVHFIGVGGIGMSALARHLMAQGYQVSGSDSLPGEQVAALAALGADVHVGHAAGQVEGADLVVVTSAAPEDNPEVREALERGIPVIKRAVLLAEIANAGRGIAVAGTHGKSTTSALIGHMLTEAGHDPTVLIGGISANLGSNARAGKSDLVVVEADEYDASFLRLQPEIAVITNVEPDHLDFYGTPEAVHDAFSRFAYQARGILVMCADDPVLANLVSASPASVNSYGLTHGDWRASHIREQSGRTTFVAAYRQETHHERHLPVGAGRFPPSAGPPDDAHRDSVRRARAMEGAPVEGHRLPHAAPPRRIQCDMTLAGNHNVLNALAAIAVCSALGVEDHVLVRALSTFRGVERRFEIKGEASGVLVMDDYAHHPTEIRVNLEAAKRRFDRPVRLVFQPHTYSRTRDFLSDFAAAFGGADTVYLLDIYAARETDTLGITGADLALAAARLHPDIRYTKSIEQTVESLLQDLVPGDLVLTMGAGDVYSVGTSLLERLAS
jgi:UDP-N-acetylmuramate--alanine ligase